jgi:RNA polymerase sigma factor (sigma-70 family)
MGPHLRAPREVAPWPARRQGSVRSNPQVLTQSEEYALARDIEAGVLAFAAMEADGLTVRDRDEFGELHRRGEAAYRRFLEANLGLVGMVANSFATNQVHVDDLFQDGYFGLVRAVMGFDTRQGTRFSTYAIPWIRKAVSESSARFGVIKVPDYALRRALTPTDTARSAAMQATDRAALVVYVPLDHPSASAASEASRVDDALEAFEVRTNVRRALAALEDRQRKVISMYFGVDIDVPLPMEEIAVRLRVSRSTVSRELQQGISHLRDISVLRNLVVPAAD